MQDWNLSDQRAGLENAGLENDGLNIDNNNVLRTSWKAIYHSSLRKIQVSHPNISEVSRQLVYMLEDKVSSTQIIRAAEDRLLWHTRQRRPPI